jgi:flagellar hook-associated protein 1 FlgK
MMVQLENQRESVSGVSLDEEMINLIKFQNAYTAAAKMITTADEMMQTVLQMI